MLTALVLTYNGERLLKSCLDSLSFCDRVLVVDSFSHDNTVALAKACGAEVIQNNWKGPAAQFMFALSHIQTGWILSLDQDEICSPLLRASIIAALATNQPLAGYRIPRRSWYYDRFMQYSGWYPDRLFRLFQTDKMEVRVSGAHYSLHPLGPVGLLTGDILHYPYENFRQHLDKINDYAQKGAEDLQARGKRGGILVGMGHALGRFLKLFIVKLGFLDGRAGFLNACHGAFYAFLKYARVNEGTWGAPYNHRLKEPDSNASNATPTPKEGRK